MKFKPIDDINILRVICETCVIIKDISAEVAPCCTVQFNCPFAKGWIDYCPNDFSRLLILESYREKLIFLEGGENYG
jgi:hypothetical protein